MEIFLLIAVDSVVLEDLVGYHFPLLIGISPLKIPAQYLRMRSSMRSSKMVRRRRVGHEGRQGGGVGGGESSTNI